MLKFLLFCLLMFDLLLNPNWATECQLIQVRQSFSFTDFTPIATITNTSHTQVTPYFFFTTSVCLLRDSAHLGYFSKEAVLITCVVQKCISNICCVKKPCMEIYWYPFEECTVVYNEQLL